MGRKRRGADLPGDAVSLRAGIEEWRRSRVRQGRMPSELWQRAVALASRHGVYAIARGVGVSYSTLQQRVEDAERCASGEGGAQEPRFVEVQPLSPLAGRASSADTVVELRDGMSRMTIRTSTGSLVDLAQLVRAFWIRGA